MYFTFLTMEENRKHDGGRIENTVGGRRNKSLRFKPLQQCYCVRTREVTLVHASCDITTLSRTHSRFTQQMVY